MKKLALSILVILIVFSGYLYATTFLYTGEAAIARMNAEEKAYLNKVERIESNMTFEDVVRILGTPDREGAGLRPTWKYEDSSMSQVAVYLQNGHAFKVRWMKIGGFVYEKSFEKH